MRRLTEQLRGHPIPRAIVQGPTGARRWNRTEPRSLCGTHVTVMEHDTGGDPKPPPPPGHGEGQVHVRRQDIGKAHQEEPSLMREHPSLPGPKPGRDQLLVLARREVDEPVDAAMGTDDAAGVGVFPKQMGRVARLGGLRRCEIAGLSGGDLEQLVPTGPRSRERLHAQNVTGGSFLCNRAEGRVLIDNRRFTEWGHVVADVEGPVTDTSTCGRSVLLQWGHVVVDVEGRQRVTGDGVHVGQASMGPRRRRRGRCRGNVCRVLAA